MSFDVVSYAQIAKPFVLMAIAVAGFVLRERRHRRFDDAVGSGDPGAELRAFAFLREKWPEGWSTWQAGRIRLTPQSLTWRGRWERQRVARDLSGAMITGTREPRKHEGRRLKRMHADCVLCLVCDGIRMELSLDHRDRRMVMKTLSDYPRDYEAGGYPDISA